MNVREQPAIPGEDPLFETAEELYETAPCGYLTTSASGDIVRVNRTLLNWLGYERQELLAGVRLVDLLTPGGRLFYETHLVLMLRAQHSIEEIALDFACKQGSILPALVNATEKPHPRNDATLNRWTIFKATSRRLYEREMLAARTLLETTLSSIGDGVIATDVNGMITFVNVVAAELTGWDPDIATGRPIEDVLQLVREETEEQIENPLRRALQTSAKVALENHTVLISADGRQFVVDDSAAPICDENGTISGAVMVFRDITRRREAERELQSAYRQLKESTAELRRSNEDLSQFAYVASHDLRSPLNTVTMYSQLLQRRYGEKLGNDGQELVGQITTATKRMAALIEDLLQYSTLSLTHEYSTEPIDADASLKIAVENLHGIIAESGAIVEWTPLPKVGIDGTSLVQLFQNLIGNAIRYRSNATPHIRVSAEKDDTFWRFSCQDNGLGIAAEHHERIFEPFKRLHGQELSGSGIGLAICKRIVQRYGGAIWVDSEVGRGSTFRFTIPA